MDPDRRRAGVLIGPRQVGKTCLLWQIAGQLLDQGHPGPNLTYFDFKDDRYDRATSLADVLDFRPQGLRQDAPRIFLLDEVTQAPAWDLALKRAVDEARTRPSASRSRFLVTDSAASILRHGAGESLQGRIDQTPIHGLTLREALQLQASDEEDPTDVLMRSPGALHRYIAVGGMPEHVTAGSHAETWRRIREDIADRAIARDLARGRRIDTERVTALFRALVQDSGGLFEPVNRARDIPMESGGGKTDPRSVREWVDLLEQACLLVRLKPWHPGKRIKSSKGLKSREKIFAEDHGFIPSFSPYLNPLAHSDVLGAIHETVVHAHLRELAERRADLQLRYFRVDEDTEVDFVLAFEDAVVGVEVTARKTPERKLRKAEDLVRRAALDRLVVVHGGLTPPEESGITASWPLGAFLLNPDEAVDRSLAWVRSR